MNLSVKRQLTKLVLTPGYIQMVKFAIVGSLNIIVSFIVFYLCYSHLHLATLVLDVMGSHGMVIRDLLYQLNIVFIDAAVANTLGYMAGMVNSFILNKHWTFEAKGKTTRQVHRFFILNVLGLLVSTFLILIFVDLLGITYLIVWPVTICLIMIMNYTGNKYWTFAEKSIIDDAARG